jgi:hypothetical protein
MCACKCGWVADPTVRDEVIDACQDEIRTCKKCGARYQRKSYGWMEIDDEKI